MWAQTYPTRTVKIVVGFPPGGGVDLTARIIAQFLSERLGQPFVIENRPGAGSNLATETVVRAAPDGYTLLMFDAPPATNAASLYDKLAFDFARDIAPVAGIIRTAHVMVVNPAFPAKSLPELIAYAKTHPRELGIASYGAGTISQVAAALFMMMAGVEMVHVPYRGSAPALTDLLGGQVQVMFAALPSAIEFIRAGKLRALAVSTATPAEQLPSVPPVASAVPGFEASGWYGVGAPRGTPPEIIARLNREINAALADPTVRTRLADSGGAVLTGSPADLAELIGTETAKWDKLIRTANIKATE
ncbi:MAG TPA: tripartite tricarboxylate transporter substrate binding protein [Xanthobacteraceae bacterium]|nr:tripartite tricarboxylate transporter substrate binding protein [Xanthobacteraceae bacterium]